MLGGQVFVTMRQKHVLLAKNGKTWKKIFLRIFTDGPHKTVLKFSSFTQLQEKTGISGQTDAIS